MDKKDIKKRIENWYGDVGFLVKLIAVFIQILGIVSSFIVFLIFAYKEMLEFALLFTIGIIISSGLVSVYIYIIGQLVQNSDKNIKIKEEKYSKIVECLVKISGIEENVETEKKQENIEKDKKEINESQAIKIKNTEEKPNLLKIFNDQNDKKVEKNKSDSNEEISKETIEKIKRISNQKTVNIKTQYKDWYKIIKELTDKEIIETIENDKDWQEPYIELCCIEYLERKRKIKK